MSERTSDADLARDVAALIRTLEDLQSELEPGDRRRLRLPTPRELLRFTSEVTIPATIVVLEANVRILRLLQRTLRATAGDADRHRSTDATRERVASLGRETLEGLDAALADLQSAVEGRPPTDEAAALLDEARRLQESVDAGLAGDVVDEDSPLGDRRAGRESVDVDVEAELRSIRDEIDDDDNEGDRSGPDP